MARKKPRRPSRTVHPGDMHVQAMASRLLHVDWELGQPLPLPLYSPLITGLGGYPRLVEGAVWVQAMAVEVEQHGVRHVFDQMATADAELGLPRRQNTDAEIATIEQEMQQEGVMAWWESLLAGLQQQMGMTPEPEPLPPGSENDAQYVATNRDLIAAYAWHGYQQTGRGAVIILQNPPADVEAPVPPTGNRVRAMSYVPLQAAQEHGYSWPGDAERMLRVYDPEAGCVVIVESPSPGETSVLRIRTLPTPPEAYRRYKDVLPALAISMRPIRRE